MCALDCYICGWEVHVEVLKCYTVLDLVHVTNQACILHVILSDLSVLIIKPKYRKHQLVFAGGYVVFTENIVTVRSITWNIGRLVGIYCILHNVSAYLPAYKEEKCDVCV
jgi:hypothetical protein